MKLAALGRDDDACNTGVARSPNHFGIVLTGVRCGVQEDAVDAKGARREVLLQLRVADTARRGFYDDQLATLGSAA